MGDCMDIVHRVNLVLRGLLKGIPVVIQGHRFQLDRNYQLCMEIKRDDGSMFLAPMNVPFKDFIDACASMTDEQLKELMNCLGVVG